MVKTKPTIESTKTIATSRFFNIESVHLLFSNGEERQFERLASRATKAVMAVPLLDDNTILLIREYCVGVDDYVLGFPKGLIDAGEDMFMAANRELQEEIGYGANDIQFLTTLSVNPGYTNLGTHIVVAKDLFESRLEGDEPEPLEVVPWKLDNLHALIKHPEFHEARSVAALMLLK